MTRTLPSPARDACRAIRRRAAMAQLFRASWRAAVAGVGVFAAWATGAGLFRPGAPRLLPAGVAGAGVFAAVFLAGLRRFRLPDADRCLAVVEALDDAGGLLMVSGRPGAEAWADPSRAIRIPSVRFRPSRPWMAAAGAAAAAAIVAAVLPDRVFARLGPIRRDPTGIRALAGREAERIDSMEKAGELAEQEAEEFRHWVEEIAAQAEETAPDVLMESLDAIAAELNAVQEASASDAEHAEATAGMSEGKAGAPADFQSAPREPGEGAPDLEAAEAQSGCSSCDRQAATAYLLEACELRECDGDDTEGVPVFVPNFGGPMHGDAPPAPMTWNDGDPSEEGLAERQERLPGSLVGDPGEGRVTGFSATTPDVPPDAAPTTPAAVRPAAPDAAGSDTRPATVLPRHRHAVRTYFEGTRP